MIDALRHHVVTVSPRPRHSRKSNIWTLGRVASLRVCEKVEKTESLHQPSISSQVKYVAQRSVGGLRAWRHLEHLSQNDNQVPTPKMERKVSQRSQDTWHVSRLYPFSCSSRFRVQHQRQAKLIHGVFYTWTQQEKCQYKHTRTLPNGTSGPKLQISADATRPELKIRDLARRAAMLKRMIKPSLAGLTEPSRRKYTTG